MKRLVVPSLGLAALATQWLLMPAAAAPAQPPKPTVTEPTSQVTTDATTLTVKGTGIAGSSVILFVDANNNGRFDDGEEHTHQDLALDGKSLEQPFSLTLPVKAGANLWTVVTWVQLDSGEEVQSVPVKLPSITKGAPTAAQPAPVTQPSATGPVGGLADAMNQAMADPDIALALRAVSLGSASDQVNQEAALAIVKAGARANNWSPMQVKTAAQALQAAGGALQAKDVVDFLGTYSIYEFNAIPEASRAAALAGTVETYRAATQQRISIGQDVVVGFFMRAAAAFPLGAGSALRFGDLQLTPERAASFLGSAGGYTDSQKQLAALRYFAGDASGMLTPAAAIYLMEAGGDQLSFTSDGRIMLTETETISAEDLNNVLAAPDGGSLSPVQVLQAAQLVALSNIIANGGGNLIGLNGSNLTPAEAVGIIANGGGNVVSNGGGNLIGLNGSNLIGLNGSNLLSLDQSATIIANGGGN